MSEQNVTAMERGRNSPELDLLIGAEAIARFLGWRSKAGGWNVRRVYHCAEKGSLPIHKHDGLGLVARQTALRAHFEFLDRQFQNSLDAESRGS